MPKLTRITHDARVMGGKACVRGMRVTVSTIVRLVAAGHSSEEILREYPYLQAATSPRPCPMRRGVPRRLKFPLGASEAANPDARPSTVASAPDSSYSG